MMQKSLKDFLDVKYNYNSNAIEGTTLSEKETSLVLKGETIANHPLREHLEILNHKKAFDFVFEQTNGFSNSKKDFSEIFTEEVILKIHYFILRGIIDENAGNYRRQNVRIAFSRAVLPSWEKVETLMKNFVEKYRKEAKKIDLKNLEEVLKFGYLLHLDFVKIHPFVDGNGRVARLLQNLWFLWSVNNLNIIYYKNRNTYIDSIENSEKDLDIYFDFMSKNFLEFKEEELDLIEKNEVFKY